MARGLDVRLDPGHVHRPGRLPVALDVAARVRAQVVQGVGRELDAVVEELVAVTVVVVDVPPGAPSAVAKGARRHLESAWWTRVPPEACGERAQLWNCLFLQDSPRSTL